MIETNFYEFIELWIPNFSKISSYLQMIVLRCCFQFLFASAHVMKLPLFRLACELAFAECDPDGNGFISENQVCCALNILML